MEIRNWKTNYRGELWIHASMTKMAKIDRENTELMALIKGVSLHYGHIICRCNLVDCVYMTKEYVDDIKQNHYNEYICGIYEADRYAWILEDIEILDTSIPTKGHLGIWSYYDKDHFDNYKK